MHRFLLPASIFTLAFVLLVDDLIPVARAESGPTLVCEEGFRSPTGINRDKVATWLAEQRAAGRANFLPFGVQGSTSMICAW